ncbi:MAG: hypothetical protein DMG59_29240, partial [Acidobacteria bacterium]
NEHGLYTFAAVSPGRYRLEAEIRGFKRFVQEPIEVRVQQFVTLNPVLEIGEASQSVEVSGQLALLDASTSSLSQIVENRQVTELPLNGRNTLALVALTPGTRTQGEFEQHTATRSFAGWGNFSSNGGMADANEVLVDGAPVTMFLVNAPSLIPPVDATQEFRVQTNNYGAEFPAPWSISASNRALTSCTVPHTNFCVTTSLTQTTSSRTAPARRHRLSPTISSAFPWAGPSFFQSSTMAAIRHSFLGILSSSGSDRRWL